MEQRKIFKSGKGSYILTLPKQWVHKNGLKEGQSVYIEELEDKLVVHLKRKKTRTANIDLGDLSFDKVVRRIIAYYLANYDVLRLKVNTDEQRRAVAFAADMLIGMEIMEDTGEEMELIVHLQSDIEIDKMLEKLGNVCLCMFSDFIRISSENLDRRIASSIAFRENEVDRFCLFILRIAENFKFFRSFARIVERIADHIEIMSEAFLKLNKKYDELSICGSLYEILRESITSFIKLDIDLAEDVLERVNLLKKDILSLQANLLKYSKEEIIYLKTIFEGLSRILAYSSDIAESVIDRVIAEKSS